MTDSPPLTAEQLVPFLLSVIASGERLTEAEVNDIRRIDATRAKASGEGRYADIAKSGTLGKYLRAEQLAEIADRDGAYKREIAALRAALAADSPVDGGLDVERLRHAKKNIERNNDRAFAFDRDADALAREYARLATPEAAAEDPIDLIERVLQPNGRCTECGGGEGYWKHGPGDPITGHHMFQPSLAATPTPTNVEHGSTHRGAGAALESPDRP